MSRFHGTSLHLRFSKTILGLSPHHLVDDAGVALDDFHDLGRDVFFDVVRHGDAVVAVGVHRDGGVDGLLEFIVTAVSTACKRDFSSMPAMKKQALSSASGHSVLVRMQIAGNG